MRVFYDNISISKTRFTCLNAADKGCIRGYTIVELMVTIFIVSILATTIGVLFVRLLTIQENDREEAYIRETLADICGVYADCLSVGESIGTNNQLTVVKYREETGGVSLETGRVSRVTRLTSLNWTQGATGGTTMKIGAIEGEDERKNFVAKHIRSLRGDAKLISQVVDKITCSITPLNYDLASIRNDYFGSLQTTDAALARLQVAAEYKIKNDEGKYVRKTATVKRIVRLWNQK